MNLWIIDFLYSNEQEIFQKDIENEFFINRATASKMLKLMEEKNLIKRVSSSTDKRLKKIILCDKGMKLQKVAKEIRIEVENKLTENLTEEETKTFKEICIKILS
jgi:DNA-binding MarR family transcriptional regulator